MKELLIGNLPTSFLIDGKEYEISSDFRTMIELEEIFSSEKLTGAKKAEQALLLFYGCIPEDLETAVEKLCFFWKCGRKEKPVKQRSWAPESVPMQKTTYSFIHDAGLIYAAFMEQYGIDLTDVEYLHWWKFMALFEALGNNTLMKEVMRCRAVDVKNDMPQQQKDYYKSMQQRYALPLPESVEKYQSALEAALMGDGNVSEVMRCVKKK